MLAILKTPAGELLETFDIPNFEVRLQAIIWRKRLFTLAPSLGKFSAEYKEVYVYHIEQ